MRIPTGFILLLLIAFTTGCDHKHNSTETPSIDNTMNRLTDKKSFKSGYIPVNGIQMYYEIYGTGTPLVLLHGGGSTIETTFGRIIPTLAQHYQLIAVELQAHGHTSDRTDDLSFEQDADDVAALLKELHITQADFFGFSNGGNTAFQIALRHPQLVKKIVAASILLKRNGTSPQFWEFMKHAKFEQMPQQYKDAFLKITNDTTRLKILHDKCAKRVNTLTDLSDEKIRSIQSPVLLVNGDADVATSEHMIYLSRLIPHCKLAILPGGHGEYMGEIMSFKAGEEINYPLLPILENFLR